jgi:Tfp pilus assembly protein PilE
MTLIELLVTVLVLTVGIVGLLGAFTSARKLTFLSERRTSAAHRAQLEIERLQTLSYGELLMSSTPIHSAEITNPDYYVKEGSPSEYQYGTGSTETETLAIAKNGECTITVKTECGVVVSSPTGRACTAKLGACEWGEGTLKGSVYDFATWHHDANAKCTKSANYKRLTVVVTVTVPSGSRAIAPTHVSTLIANPKETKTEIEGC